MLEVKGRALITDVMHPDGRMVHYDTATSSVKRNRETCEEMIGNIGTGRALRQDDPTFLLSERFVSLREISYTPLLIRTNGRGRCFLHRSRHPARMNPPRGSEPIRTPPLVKATPFPFRECLLPPTVDGAKPRTSF